MMRALAAWLAVAVVLGGCLADDDRVADRTPAPSVDASGSATQAPAPQTVDVLDQFEDAILRKLAETGQAP